MSNVLSKNLPQGVVCVDPARTTLVDVELRDRLDRSFQHISDVLAAQLGQDLDGINEFRTRLRAGPVSPWVFGLYSKLVAELSRNELDGALQTFGELRHASLLPFSPGLIELGHRAVPSSWWEHFCLLFDTDRNRRFKFRPPKAEDSRLCQEEVERALTLVSQSDPLLHDELRQLIRMIVLGGTDSSQGFGGASTFFFWGAILLNAEARHSVIGTIDRLVHEGSHVLLFGLSSAGSLTDNDGSERYTSAVRADPRPIEGIFHACFVTTRVHLVMGRLLDSGSLSLADKEFAINCRSTNGEAARASLHTLSEHARLTKVGNGIYCDLRDYWSTN